MMAQLVRKRCPQRRLGLAWTRLRCNVRLHLRRWPRLPTEVHRSSGAWMIQHVQPLLITPLRPPITCLLCHPCRLSLNNHQPHQSRRKKSIELLRHRHPWQHHNRRRQSMNRQHVRWKSMRTTTTVAMTNQRRSKRASATALGRLVALHRLRRLVRLRSKQSDLFITTY